jgi:hypothetical protein
LKVMWSYPYTLLRNEAIVEAFLTLALGESDSSVSRLWRFTPRIGPRYALNRRLVRPQNWPGCSGEEKISFPCRESNQCWSAHSLFAIPTELSWLLCQIEHTYIVDLSIFVRWALRNRM